MLAHRIRESLAEPFGARRVRCGLCGWSGRRFRSHQSGAYVRRDAACPKCHSLERHRAFLELFEAVRASLPGVVRVLDIAPTAAFDRYCRSDPRIDYLSVDLQSSLAMRHMDVQGLELEDAAFDVVVCYHVLDYVPDDVRALGEIARVLKPSGVAILQEVVRGDADTEEWGSPRRTELYRIRQYGRDFPARVQAAGLHVWKARVADALPVWLASRIPPAFLDRLGERWPAEPWSRAR